MKEIWKNIVGYGNNYMVSNFGRVKSMPRKIDNGFNKRLSREKILKPSIREGYERVCLCDNKKDCRISIHRLVAEAFIPNPHNLKQINHKDFIKNNNHVSNLEWCSPSQNVQHFLKGNRRTCRTGDNHHSTKISQEIAAKIKQIHKEQKIGALRIKNLLEIKNVSVQAIHHIISGKNFKYIH